MRHNKDTRKLNRTSSHRRCLQANLLKSLIENERVITTVPIAKSLKRYADRLVTLAKKNTLASRRRVIADLMVRFNALTPKEKRAAKEGDTSSYSADRVVVKKLFDEIGPRFKSRNGGYTRMTRCGYRKGDQAELCVIEYLPE